MSSAAALEARVRERARQIIEQAAPILERRLKDAAPVSPGYPEAPAPGRLRDSIGVRPASETSVVAEATAEHASFTEEDTAPHVILPTRGRVLRFYSPAAGGFVFARRVEHPGTTGTHWFRGVTEQWGDVLREAQ